ncbi:MAG: translation initiation factor IF-3 [Candidatus Colwellbacteria bacterium]|nr:translation initiation factor IF-3 [Candidatus Colwellbacteria bacterium]
MLDETGNNLGVLSRDRALELAREKGLDLILISPKAVPPVARILSFDKFRYEKEKELKKQRKKAPELKRIQIGIKTAKNDLMVRLKKLEEFLEHGHKVEIQMTLRGREKANRSWAEERLNEFLGMITTPYKIAQPIKPSGRGLTVQIDPGK